MFKFALVFILNIKETKIHFFIDFPIGFKTYLQYYQLLIL